METWGHHLTGKRVIIRCDNSATVDCINHGGRVRDGGMMVGMRELAMSAVPSIRSMSGAIGSRRRRTFSPIRRVARTRDGWGAFFRHCKEQLGLEPAQLTQVEPTLDTAAVLEKIRRVHLAKARREAVGDDACAGRPPR